jgi:hypothetical protein
VPNRLLLAAALLLGTGCTAATPAYPPSPGSVLTQLVESPALWADRFVGLEGTLLGTSEGARGQLMLHVRARDAAGEERELSVGSLPTPPDGWLEEGDRLKLGGYVTFVSEDDEVESGAPLRGVYLLLAACVVNQSRDQALIHPTALMNCQAWSAGADPESLAPMR